MTITATNRIEQRTTQPDNGWQGVLSAMRYLQTVDVALVKRAVADVDDELCELRQAHEVISAKLRQAERQQGAIEGQFEEIFSLTALIRKALDTDHNFRSLYGDDAETAIEHVKPLCGITE